MRLAGVSAVFLAIGLSSAFENCPILGPVFPRPTDLASGVLKHAFSNLTTSLERALATGNSSHGPLSNATAYSVQIFSLDNKKPLYDFHHTPPAVKNSRIGVNHVDGDSIYRIGSISKLITVYTLLLEIGDSYWNRPVTEFLPELRSQAKRSKSDPFDFVAWEDVTLGALAGHEAGVTRDLSVIPTSIKLLIKYASALGLPEMKPSEYPPCILNITNQCNKTEYLQALITRQPTYLPNTTPIYSNTGFQILAYALESITGKSYQKMVKKDIIDQLKLTGTSYSKPADSDGVIPGESSAPWWNFDMGDSTTDGGFYASPNDLSAIGRSILGSELLDANITRAWMKPTSHTSSLLGSVGRPWEIFRQELPRPSNRVVDIYTKSGSLSTYQSLLALVPDYGIGFVTFGVGQEAASPAPINGKIADIVLPELENIAREQAHQAYAGMYKAAGNVNSSVTLTTNPSQPGMGISSYISNGTDFYDSIKAISGFSKDEFSLRIYPTNVEARSEERCGSSGERIAFRMVTEFISTFENSGAFSACPTWFNVDASMWRNYAMDEMLFTLNDDGTEAEYLDLRFLDVKLRKVK